MAEERFLMPQEIEVLYVIPAIRRQFAIALKAEGSDQKSIAILLHVTEAAISQYISGKRASQVVFDDATKAEIAKAAKRAQKTGSFLVESQKMLDLIRKRKITCKAHRDFGGAADDCDVCFTCDSASGYTHIDVPVSKRNGKRLAISREGN